MGEHGKCGELVGLMGGAGRGFPGVFYPSSIRLYARWMGPVLTFWFGALVDAARAPSLSTKGAGASEGSGGWWAVVHLTVYQVVIVGELR